MSELTKEQRCGRSLTSDEMQPFWKMLDHLELTVMGDLRKTRDGSITHALDVIDRVRDFPRRLAGAKKTVDAEEQ